MASIKAKGDCIDILRAYNGQNPYILKIKKDILANKVNSLTDFAIEYILNNKDFKDKEINKTIKIADWYGENLQKTYDIEFIPEKLRIYSLLGITSGFFHCCVKYRQNMEPLFLFIPKKAV